jgi:hypothetical protein
MKSCCGVDRAPSEFDLRELDAFRRLKKHSEIATARALDYCATHEICPPAWLAEAAASLMIELLKREKTSRRGRTASHLARFQQELRDTERWFAVHEVRRIREASKQDDLALKALPNGAGTEGWRKRHENRKRWLKMGTSECAANLLEGRDAHVTASAVRASYRRVESSLRDPTVAVGAWFDDAFLKKLGLQGSGDQKPGSKMPYFSDLT